MVKKNDKKKDNQINELIRELSLTSCCVYSHNIATRYSRTTLEDSISQMKDKIFSIVFEDIIDDVELKFLYITILDYIGELSYLGEKDNIESIRNQIIIIKQRMLPILKEKGIKAELLLLAMNTGGKFLSDDNEKSEAIEAIAGIATLLTEYLQTYNYKFKNKIISKFSSDDGHLVIKYSSYDLFYKEQIDYIKKFTNSGEEDISGKFDEYVFKITEQLSQAYFKCFCSNNENHMGYLHIEQELELPLISEDGSTGLSDEEILSIPKQRQYAIHKNGVEFLFRNKKSLEKIEMYEDEKRIKFNVFVLNNGKMYKSKLTENSIKSLANPFDENLITSCKKQLKKEKVSDKVVKLCFEINKEKFLNTINKEDKIICIKNTNYVNSSEKLLFPVYIRLILLTCVYLAYNNPNRFSSEVSIFNRTFDKITKRKKQSDFIIGHIRRLPKGSTMSGQAKLNAQKEGFLYIPDGHTFVKTVSRNQSFDKKIIKI